MTPHYTIHHRPLFGALEELMSHTGTLNLRLGAAGARLGAAAQALPNAVREEATSLAERIAQALGRPGGPGLTEAIGLARQMVDLYDRYATTEGQCRKVLFRRAWQRLHAAVLILCSEPGSIQERLSDVYLSAFVYWTAADIPQPCEREFLALKEELAQVVQFRGLAVERARFLAHQILLLYARVLELEFESGIDRSRELGVGLSPVVSERTPRGDRPKRPQLNRVG
ncbi:hypothetical protein SVA_0929 [Sulfurifustis variabilis]|uniref:Uncharacterized protein n=1 Tax=Sulfurifustis variabilis TaxID=1675686 RepID=A0A1B4V1X9_9GAMM|nr:hypothetical protein [Sulfurifustis variabilis]BAU47508.1 hypothetical protein SVA_0929 [Sulfurifustis variabilis]